MNKQFTNSAYLSYKSNENQTLFVLKHPLFSATISEFGGQLLNFEPIDSQPLVWLSNSAKLDCSKPIRGGAPICWPWFGPAPTHFEGEPQHGYARNLSWQLESLTESEEQVNLVLTPKLPEPLNEKLQLALKLEYTFNKAAEITLSTTNVGNHAFELSAAIHTYLNIPSSPDTEIPDLLNCVYMDKLTNSIEQQSEPFQLNQAMDRIYHYQDANLEVVNKNTKVQITNDGHDSIVVWNPWKQGSEAMVDFDDNGYLSMLCVESALTRGYSLMPGNTHKLKQKLCFKR